ncbi:MAG: hypothetical protein ABL934_02325 [Lysobacteraceae bacterium]
MTVRSLFLSTTFVASSLFAFAANAHDPSLHEPQPSAKAIPTTCVQLADTKHYSNDTTNADIKALKTHCDAEKAAAARKAKPAGDKK